MDPVGLSDELHGNLLEVNGISIGGYSSRLFETLNLRGRASKEIDSGCSKIKETIQTQNKYGFHRSMWNLHCSPQFVDAA